MDNRKTERKRSLTLNLSEEEMAALASLADRYGMSKSAWLRQAIHAAVAKNDVIKREPAP